jgi:hypothetical protein
MAGKWYLIAGREDSDLGGMGRVLRRQHEGRFREIELGGDCLHLPARQAFRVEDNAERIARKLRAGEDVDGDEVQFHLGPEDL